MLDEVFLDLASPLRLGPRRRLDWHPCSNLTIDPTERSISFILFDSTVRENDQDCRYNRQLCEGVVQNLTPYGLVVYTQRV